MGAWERGSEGRDYVFIWLIHFIVQQKLAQHCKVIILQKKVNKYILKINKELSE